MARSYSPGSPATRHAVSTLIILALPCLFTSCTGDVCGDIWNHSPAQLLAQNEFVLFARLDSVDTLIDLGTMEYLGTPSDFAILSYRFSPVEVLKAPGDASSMSLWNCERSKPTFTTMLPFNTGDTVLLYGRELLANDSLLLVMEPMAPVSDLLRVLLGKAPKVDWNDRDADSAIGVAIDTSDMLANCLTMERGAGGVVLYCPEQYCLTMKDYHDGRLCYYDSANVGHSVTSAEYRYALEKLTLSPN